MISVRTADVWASKLVRGMRDKLGKEATSMVEDLEKKTGLRPDNIDRMTVVMKESPDARPLVFFGTSKAFDHAKVFAVVPGGKKEKYSGESIFANEHEAIYVLGEKAFVLGAKNDIQSLIDAGKDKPVGDWCRRWLWRRGDIPWWSASTRRSWLRSRTCSLPRRSRSSRFSRRPRQR